MQSWIKSVGHHYICRIEISGDFTGQATVDTYVKFIGDNKVGENCEFGHAAKIIEVDAGNNLKVGARTVINCTDLGNDVTIGNNCIINAKSIGNNVTIGNNCEIEHDVNIPDGMSVPDMNYVMNDPDFNEVIFFKVKPAK
mgnify:CR=1 FL=1